MEFILQNLSSNRVTLDVNSNRFEESYEYDSERSADVEFARIEDLFDKYKKLISAPNSRAPKSETPVLDSKIEKPSDRFLYCVLLGLDPTISLVPDKSDFVEKFKTEMKNKLENLWHKLKKFAETKKSVVDAVDGIGDFGVLARYVSILAERSILVLSDVDANLYCNSFDACKIIDTHKLSCEETSISDAKRLFYEKNLSRLKESMTLEKLNLLLVKSLKDTAESIGCETSKIEDGKKRNLLKAELREVIKLKLYA